MKRTRKKAKDILGIYRKMEHDSYLGLPLLFGRSKARELRVIKKKVGRELKARGDCYLKQKEQL